MVSSIPTRSFLKHLLQIKMFKTTSTPTPIVFDKQNNITPSCVNFTFKIHKGANFRLLKVSRFAIGYKFGEFILTRKPHAFVKKKKKSAARR